MSDTFSMWDEPTEQITAQREADHLALAEAAAEPLWPYLSRAKTQSEFEGRLALAGESLRRMTAAVVDDADEHLPVVRQRLAERHTALRMETALAQTLAEAQKTAGYAIVAPGSDKPLWGMVYDTEEGARAHHDEIKDRTDDMVPRGIKDYTVKQVSAPPNRTLDKDAPHNNRFQPYFGAKTAGWVNKARAVVQSQGYLTVDGVLLDLTTAHMLMQVHDALSEGNRAKFAAMPLQQAVATGWKLVSKTSKVATKAEDVQRGDVVVDGAGDRWTVSRTRARTEDSSGVEFQFEETGDAWHRYIVGDDLTVEGQTKTSAQVGTDPEYIRTDAEGNEIGRAVVASEWPDHEVDLVIHYEPPHARCRLCGQPAHFSDGGKGKAVHGSVGKTAVADALGASLRPGDVVEVAPLDRTKEADSGEVVDIHGDRVLVAFDESSAQYFTGDRLLRIAKTAEWDMRTVEQGQYDSGYYNGKRDREGGNDPQGVGFGPVGADPTPYERGYWDGYGLKPYSPSRYASKTAETHAPYRIEQDGEKWKVVNDLGETKGTHDSEEQAREQQKALYANVPGSSEQAEKKSSAKWATAVERWGLSPQEMRAEAAESDHSPNYSLDGVRFRVSGEDLIGWMSDWGAPYEQGWIERGLVGIVEHDSGGLGGFSYRLTEKGKQQAQKISQSAVQALLSEAYAPRQDGPSSRPTVQTPDYLCEGCGRPVDANEAFLRGDAIADRPKAYCRQCAWRNGWLTQPRYHGSRKTAAGPIRWQVDTHFTAPYLKGKAANGDNYEVYENPNSNPTPCSWVNYGPELDGDTAPLNGPHKGVGRGFATMQEAMRAAEQDAAGTTASRHHGYGREDWDEIAEDDGAYDLGAEHSRQGLPPQVEDPDSDFGTAYMQGYHGSRTADRTAYASRTAAEDLNVYDQGYHDGYMDGTRGGRGGFALQNTGRGSETDYAEGYYKGFDAAVYSEDNMLPVIGSGSRVEALLASVTEQDWLEIEGGRRPGGRYYEASRRALHPDLYFSSHGASMLDRIKSTDIGRVRQAVNTDAEGAARYQSTPAPATPEWVNDAWGAPNPPIPLHARDRENPFSKDTLERVQRQRAEGARREAVDFKEWEQNSDFDPESAGSMPRTTRPRVMPNEHRPPQQKTPPRAQDSTNLPDADIEGYTTRKPEPAQPTPEQKTTARVARLTRRVLADNPTMDRAEAHRLAVATVNRYPEMVSA